MDNTLTLPEPEENKQMDKQMDKKAREIIGLPVITFNRGTKIYDVQDLIVDPERRQVLALVVSERAFFHSARAIPFGRISAIGSDSVIVPDGKAVIDVDRDKVLKSLDNDQLVKGLKVLTDDGSKLGEIADMLIDTKTGEIRGYYVSQGRALSMGQGLRWLPAGSVISAGQRVAYVPAEVAKDFESQSGGLANALDQAGNRLRDAGSRANARLEGMGEKARATGGKFNEQLARYGDQARETLPQRAATLLVGRTAHKEVLTPEDTPIVSEGDTITQEHVETARTTGRLPQLLMSAGVGPAREGIDNIGEQTGQSWSDMRTEARDLWNQITGGYTRMVDQTDDKFMQRRVKHALGRPVTRVILDADDNIILNTGDIITNRAVQAANEAGVLDVLVDSVYTERPKLGIEELKAPQSGQASLEKAIEANGASSQAARATRPAGQRPSSDTTQPPPR
jgi:uncharacterized protein YrrD